MACGTSSMLLLLLLCAPLLQAETDGPQIPQSTRSTTTDTRTSLPSKTSATTKFSSVSTTNTTLASAPASNNVFSNITVRTEHSSAATNSTPHPGNVSNTTQQSGWTHTTDITASTTNHTAEHTNRTEAPHNTEVSQGLSDNPGLVAILCIFICVLCVALVVTAVRFCQKPTPEFQKLDEVPMNGMTEEAPFARYPPK